MNISEKSLSSTQSLVVAAGGTFLGATLSRRWASTPNRSATTDLGPVWVALYACTAIGAWRLLKAAPSVPRSKAIKLWTAHLGLNALWSKLFFGRKTSKASL